MLLCVKAVGTVTRRCWCCYHTFLHSNHTMDLHCFFHWLQVLVNFCFALSSAIFWLYKNIFSNGVILLYFIKIITRILNSCFPLLNGKISCSLGGFANAVARTFAMSWFEEVSDVIYSKHMFVVRNDVKETENWGCKSSNGQFSKNGTFFGIS